MAKPSAAAIHDTLRDRICLLDYLPGTVLREADLARAFGVSRTPVRAALQRLAHGGLIESRDGVGTIVTAPSAEEILDTYRMRLKVAELIGEMAPRPIGPAHLAAADALLARAERIAARFDIAEYWRINHDLHGLIGELIGSAALHRMWDDLYYQAARMWYRHARDHSTGVADDLVAELRETRNAIAHRDPVAVGYAQRNHIAYGLQRLRDDEGDEDG